MSTNVTHVTVRECLPPKRLTTVVAHLFPIVQEVEPETVFRITDNEEKDEPAEKSVEDQAETKVVRGRRRVAPKATETAETK